MAHPGLKKYKITIPAQLQKEKYGFCFNEYKKPFEEKWDEKKNTYKYNDERLLKRLDKNRNYGVVGGIGNLMIVDADAAKISEAFNKLMETLTITTGNGEHFYYEVPVLDKSYALSDIDEEETKKQTAEKGEFILVLKNIGHITSTGRQVVGPNCPHYNQTKDGWEPSGKYYRIKKDLPIRTLTKEMVLDTIKPFLAENIRAKHENRQEEAKTDIANRLSIPIQKIVDVIEKEHPDWLHVSTSPPGYRGHNPSHPQSKSRMDLTINTQTTGKYSNWWICSACCHNGYGFGNALYLIALYEGILQCHECKKEGLRGEKFTRVMDLAIKKYGIPEEAFRSDLYKNKSKEPSISIEGDLPLTRNDDETLSEGAYLNDDSFIGRFTKYIDTRTNAPPPYATNLCILLLGNAMGWKTVNRMQPKAVHHNINLLLMGPSGRARKSTAQELAKDVYLSEFSMPDGFSPEGYLKHLSTTAGSQGIGYLGEFSTFLRGINNGGPLANFKEITNDLYSCPEMYVKRLSKEKDSFIIEKPYLSLISTCTEEGMIPNLNQDIVHGGFLPRYIMVYGVSKYRKLQKLSEEVDKEETYFRSAFRQISEMFKKENITFELTTDGEDALDDIGRELEENSYWNGVSPFIARIPNNIVKYADIMRISDMIGTSQLSSLSSLSSLSQLSQLTHTHTISPDKMHLDKKTSKNDDVCIVLDSSANRDNRDNRDNRETKKIVFTINSDYIKKAWKLLKPTLEYTRRFVRYVDEDLTLSKVESVIEKSAPVERSRALQYSHLKNKDFNEAIETLQDRESIFSLAIINTVRGRRRTKFVFCCRKFIASKKCAKCVYHCKEDERTPHLHEITTNDEHSDVVITATPKEGEKECYVEGPPEQAAFKTESEPVVIYTPTDVKEYVKKVESSNGAPGLTDELLNDQFPFSLIAGLIESQQLVPFFDNSGFHKYTWNKESFE